KSAVALKAPMAAVRRRRSRLRRCRSRSSILSTSSSQGLSAMLSQQPSNPNRPNCFNRAFIASVSFIVFILCHAVVAAECMGLHDQVSVFLWSDARGHWWRQLASGTVAVQDVADGANVDSVSFEHFDHRLFEV